MEKEIENTMRGGERKKEFKVGEGYTCQSPWKESQSWAPRAGPFCFARLLHWFIISFLSISVFFCSLNTTSKDVYEEKSLAKVRKIRRGKAGLEEKQLQHMWARVTKVLLLLLTSGQKHQQ